MLWLFLDMSMQEIVLCFYIMAVNKVQQSRHGRMYDKYEYGTYMMCEWIMISDKGYLMDFDITIN